MADQQDPASHVWDLLYVAGLVPELESLQVLSRRAKKRVPAIDKRSASKRVSDALDGILKSVRSGPAQLDPVQQHVNAELKLDMDAVATKKEVPLLHGNEIAKAVIALVDIQAKGEVQVDPKKVGELARLTANSPTLDEVVPPPGPGGPDTGDGDPLAAVELSDRQLNKAVATYGRRANAAAEVVAKALEHATNGVPNGALAFDAARRESSATEISHLRGTKLDEVREEVLDGCNNLTVIMPDGREAARIFTRYTTDDPVSSFIWPANPPNWPAANQYTLFRGMKASDSTKLKGLRDPLHKGYTANFVEKVRITTGEVETELAIRFFVEGAKSNKFEGKTKEDLINENPNATVVGMTFDLARNGGGDGNIDVDFGYLHVQRMPNGRTEVKAQKTVRFTRSDNAPSGYACLLGWLTSVRAMNSVQPQE